MKKIAVFKGNPNWLANGKLLLHLPPWIRTICRGGERVNVSPPCIVLLFASPCSTASTLVVLTYEQLCRDNSYYCLLVFMIGFHTQYDFLTTVPRTWKGHLPHPISVTVKEHPSPWQQKEGKVRGKRGRNGSSADQRRHLHRGRTKAYFGLSKCQQRQSASYYFN